jgi:hypothetical protein
MANILDEAHPELTEESLNTFLSTSAVPMTDRIPLESVSNLFKIPDNPQFAYNSFGEPFERYKVKVDLLKWLIGTVGLTLITFIINWGFRDREQGMNEISQYDKYASELIVLNDNPVKKRMLAQFFANVTPSEKLKDGWQKYYGEVDEEYNQFIKEAITEKNRLAELNKKDSTRLNKSEKNEIKNLEFKVQENESIINAPLLIPELSVKYTENLKNVVSDRFLKNNNKDIVMAKRFEDEGFNHLINKDIDNAIKSFTKSENSFNGYNMVYDIAFYLKKNRNELLNNDIDGWKTMYAILQAKYSYKMPEKYKSKFANLSK